MDTQAVKGTAPCAAAATPAPMQPCGPCAHLWVSGEELTSQLVASLPALCRCGSSRPVGLVGLPRSAASRAAPPCGVAATLLPPLPLPRRHVCCFSRRWWVLGEGSCCQAGAELISSSSASCCLPSAGDPLLHHKGITRQADVRKECSNLGCMTVPTRRTGAGLQGCATACALGPPTHLHSQLLPLSPAAATVESKL